MSARDKLEARILEAAEAALADHGYVSSIDVLLGSGRLHPSHVEQWRKGRLDFLERMIQGNLSKISLAMSAFRQWAEARGLKPSETRYVRATRAGPVDLQFSVSGDPEIEKAYRTHYVSPALGERQREKLEAKLSRDPQPVVFQILRDAQCSECGTEIESDDLLFMEAGQPLCLACAGMANLEYLPRGDAAVTRRATKYSGRTAVVVRFSRSRGRYERQGILVEPEALAKAESESAADAEERARARARGAATRAREDARLAEEMAAKIQALFPRCPPEEARRIAAHTAKRGSGRVGRTAAGRALDEQALTLAVRAAVRHNLTNYDELLASGVDRESARERVWDRVEEILAGWR